MPTIEATDRFHDYHRIYLKNLQETSRAEDMRQNLLENHLHHIQQTVKSIDPTRGLIIDVYV